jgi:4-amino-4-deoxy-L-arabinose transferase-like glycosyltransferase
MDANTQTTPVDWFEAIPWWSKLSFHDAPPLVFILQFLTFKLFGISTFTARLPFALAGLGSVILLYFVIKKLYHANAALLGSFILSILTYHVWASRVGYLEAVALFFILLTIYLFLLALDNLGILFCLASLWG